MAPNMDKGSTLSIVGISTREAGLITKLMAWGSTSLFLELIFRASGATARNMAKALLNSKMEIDMKVSLTKIYSMALAP